MMAVNPPLMHSPNSNLMSAFSPYTDSPSSPAPYHHDTLLPSSRRSDRRSDDSGHLIPPPQKSPNAPSLTDISDPSPIAPSSNGTEIIDIDDTLIESEDSDNTPHLEQGEMPLPKPTPDSQLKVSTTRDNQNRATRSGSAEDDQPSSVIHVPKSFEQFHARRSPPSIRHSTPTPSQISEITVISAHNDAINGEKQLQKSPMSPPPISTAIESAPARDWTATPRAQTRQEAEAEQQEKGAKLKSTSLEDIPEALDAEQQNERTPVHHDALFDDALGQMQQTAGEVAALKLALSECWTLCNTLAGLSHVHRQRIFSHRHTHSRSGNQQEEAWKSCWKLCKKLYETREQDFETHVRPILDLTREFCQALFEVRQKENDVADSVLRVSFELNNHLYNTHDRLLPNAFRERTLDFYITLCHRLMKQRTRLGAETDALLRACWYLAEMLFSLRQNRRDGKPADEELLGSAVQACWELCDLFREGWSQVRPERGTPRPSQTTFMQAFHQAQATEQASTISIVESELDMEDYDFGRQNPETPTTVFEDTQQMSPDEGQPPNILILGPDSSDRFGPHSNGLQKWSSSSSTLSGYSQSASSASETTTSSTSTIIHPPDEDPRLSCLKLLIVKAALDTGFQRPSPHPHHHPLANKSSLATYVKILPSNAFGTAPWQTLLLENYKKLVASDPAFRSAGPVRRADVGDVGRAVNWMVGSGRYAWLRDLFRMVVGCQVEDLSQNNGRAFLEG